MTAAICATSRASSRRSSRAISESLSVAGTAALSSPADSTTLLVNSSTKSGTPSVLATIAATVSALQAVCGGDVGDQPRAFGAAQAIQRQDGCLGTRQPRRREVRPRRHQDEQPRLADAVGEARHQFERGGVDPVRVLQHQEDRITLAQMDDLVDKERDGRRLPLRRRQRQLRRRRLGRDRQEVSQQRDRGFVRRGAPREYCPELVDAGTRRVGGRKSGSPSEMLDDRIEHAVPVIGRALQVNPGVKLMGDIFLQRLDRARFADTSLADHADDLTLARAGETPALEHQPHFVRPADERQRTGADRGEAALDRRFAEHA
ncbi:MAG TPA: hypothetical protein VGP50_17205, partial [Stellaceae bacterium]|nr:hypothetical protein [Stellaceae bacterium]